MLIATSLFTTAVAVEVLREFVERVAYVHSTPLRGVPARIDTSGERPVVWLNSEASAKDQAGALMDVMRILVLGTSSENVRPARRLSAVGEAS